MTVIAIGLDSAEPTLIEKWMENGSLPEMAKLREKGAYGKLENYDIFTAELPWTTFATGAEPEKTGYWTPLKYSLDYSIGTRAAYEYDEYQAFYALGDDYRVCSFDIPQVRLQDKLNGIQINAWGAHSPQVDQESNPPSAIQELHDRYGFHPGLHRDYAHTLNMDTTKNVYGMLMEGAKKRGDACIDLLKKEKWDLFLTVFGEAHGAGHNFWQFQPDHPLYDAIPGRGKLPKDPLKDCYQEMDKQIGRIVDAAPNGSDIIIYSAHGMGSNTMDLPSGLFLPEFMYRYHFERPALCNLKMTQKQITKQKWNDWERHVWSSLEAGSYLSRFNRKYLHSKIYNVLAPFIDDDVDGYPMSPRTSATKNKDIPWFQPTVWYADLWPKMRAFALPSFSEGYVRINLKGREQNGIVELSDYHKEIDKICEALGKMVCSRSGVPMVRKLVKTRENPLDKNPKLSDADLIVAWQEEYASDSVEHPKFGRIGPAPHYRAGSHRHSGFILASGKCIPQGKTVSGHAIDIGPTILDRMSAPIPRHLQGQPIKFS